MNRRYDRRAAMMLVAGVVGGLLTGCGTAPQRPMPAPPNAATAVPALPGRLSDDADERFKLALELMQDLQIEDARAAFTGLAIDYPQLSGPLTNLGILDAQGSDPDAAVRSFSMAVEANPGNAVACNWLGILYRQKGDYARAEAAYRQALTAQPEYASAHLNLAILYDVSLHQPAEALAHYREYQRLTGGEDLIVTAWIRELETLTARTVAGGAAP